MANEEYSWFDEKAHSGEQLTYEDKKRLFKEYFSSIGIRFSNRDMEKLEKGLGQQIHFMKDPDLETAHTLAHGLLTCFSPLMSLDEAQFQKHMDNYKKVDRKHEPFCCFKRNYKTR